jgi:ABC-type iron transport system FetAB permease component
MTHNTAQTIGLIAFLGFVGYVCFWFNSPWYLLLLLLACGTFRTDKEMEKHEKDEQTARDRATDE